MEFKGLILSSLILLAFFAANVHAIQDAGSVSVETGQSLADKLIEESNTGSVYKNNYGFAPTPKAQRELDKNKSSLDWTMPSTLTGGGSSAKGSRALAESSGEEAESSTATEETASSADTSAATDTELPPAQPEAANVGGSWYFTLNDSVVRDLAMVLFQKGDDVFGAGKIKEGDNTLDVTISGSVADATLDLNIVSLGTISLYKLKLDL
ncbi:MAG: hypothetical protein QG575_1220, partial [Euryarchaeota archaeon]|nr:hypothetical protein [Euryarchaeota archaeon]